MKLFKTAEAILHEIAAMESAEHDRREDRATVSEFFNGRPPMTDEEARAIGLTINVNNLFGYTELAETKSQALALFTKPTEFFRVQIDAMPQSRIFERGSWEAEAVQGFNDLLKDSGRFKPAYEGCCGDACLHGEAVFTMPNATDWCPSQTPLSKMLVPDDSPTDTTRMTHWAIESELSLRQLHCYAKGDFEGWKTGSLKKAISRIYKDVASAMGDNFDSMNPEEMEHKRQQNTGETYRRRPTLKVYYFYQVRQDKEGSPVDLTITLHKNESTLIGEDATAEEKVLFSKECFFSSIREVLNPSFMDCTLGGEPEWHRVLGTGTLNYGLNQAVEVLINRAMQGTIEGMMNLWQAQDGASREEVQEVLMRHNGIIPENIKLVEQRFTADLGGSLNMIQFFRSQGSRNARRSTSSGEGNNLLEVQAKDEQSQRDEIASARTANWYDHLDNLGRVMWGRLTNPFIRSYDPGYSDVRKFQARMERLGIPLYYLQGHNVRVSAIRILGDGSKAREREQAAFVAANMSMLPPQSQQRAKRLLFGAMTSHRLADELIPIQDKPDTSQVLRAETENNTCILQGRAMPVQDDDVDDVHFPVHLEAMIALVTKASEDQNATFTPQDSRGFKALGAHCVATIQKVEEMVGQGKADPNKAKSKQWMQALNEVVSVGEQMQHNLEQKQEGNEEKPDPIALAKLQLDTQKLKLQMDKLGFSQTKWERQQMNKESDGAFKRMQDLQRNDREERLANAKIGQGDVKTALDVQKTAQEKKNPPAEK